MSLPIIITLFVLALVLCLVETFLLPGFGICGVLSAVFALIGVGACFSYSVTAGLLATAAVLLVGAALLYWVIHSKHIARLSLHATINSSVANDAINNIAVGDQGVALTRLALVGNARIGNTECEVRSAQGFIDEGTPVVVTKIHMGEVYVERSDNQKK